MQPVPGKLLTFVGAVAGVALIGFVDWATGVEVSISILYLIPISLAAWYGGKSAGCCVALVAAAVWLAIELTEGVAGAHPWIAYWNATVRLTLFLVTTFVLHHIHGLTSNLNSLVKKRTVALENEMARRKELEREAVDICQREQERVAHELHDHLGSCLAGVAFRIRVLADKLQTRAAPESADAAEVLAAVHQAHDQVRSFARLLAVAAGAEVGLQAVLTELGLEVERAFGVACAVKAAADLPEFSQEKVQHLYHIAQEAIRNGIQHAQAERVEVRVGVDQDSLVLTIRNDGKPWDDPGRPSRGLGLRIMRHRTALLGGALAIQKAEPAGTVLECRVPLTALRPGATDPERIERLPPPSLGQRPGAEQPSGA